ncbi:hypothetical protein [Ekhidna sp.]|uniref:hypothetical protein n=1 Tax=Ekhidna sp. TaxID=2608089 RepID=UPI0035119355
MKTLLPILIVLILVGCGNTDSKTKSGTPQKKSTPKNSPAIVKAGPTYESFYDTSTIELETISYSGKIDQETAIKIISNSCDEVKADFLNYMMDAYKTIEPAPSQIEPMFDAEHIGKFIVWQLKNNETDCFPEIFSALNKIFRDADEDAFMLAKYGIYQMMIYESRRLDVNYNSAFNEWLNGPTRGQWFLLIDEMESGRS